ncbi:hypothetical protein CDIOL_50120 [Clostridium diolis]|uniref:Uncharacterized protein n=1 Tax=Clostridium diolis TaxID=223919 RepID=A0AAV3WAD9_9CLOT|nr:hypothetical protein CDIOL_50120 [Clostridium diolis]
MRISRRNKNYAVVPVSKEIMMDDSKITSCTQDAGLKGKRSQRKFEERNVKFRFSLFELAHLEQLLI